MSLVKGMKYSVAEGGRNYDVVVVEEYPIKTDEPKPNAPLL